MSIVIVASVIVKEEFLRTTKSKMLDLVEKSRYDEGCITYDLLQDKKKSNVFLFFEKWETRILWKKHLTSSHVQSFVKETKNNITEFKVQEMNLIAKNNS